MTESRRSPAATTAAVLKDWLPTARRESVEVLKEAAQTTTWLVTLASGLLTFVALRPPPPPGWSANTDYPRLLSALIATIAFGVAQRAIQLWMFRWATEQDLVLFAQLMSGTTDTRAPKAVDKMDSVDAIVNELKAFFRIDAQWIKDSGATLEEAQARYRSHFEHWEAHEGRISNNLSEVLAAYHGRSPTEFIVLSKSAAEFDNIRRRGRNIRWLGYLSVGLFVLTAAAFLYSAVLLASRVT